MLMSGEEPEVPLTRAGLLLVLGGILVGLGESEYVEHGSLLSQGLLLVGGLLIATGVLATLKAIYRFWSERR